MNTSSGRMILVCLASGQDDMSSGQMEQWTDGRPDGSIVRTADRELGILLTCKQK